MPKKISIIVAMGLNRVIGLANKLPWEEPIPADWEHLEQVTAGKKMIMGKSSYDSPHRVWSKEGNIVLSRKQDLVLDEGFSYASSLTEALNRYSEEEEVFVIGGAGVFAEALKICTNFYLTTVHQDFHGDTFFPEFDRSQFTVAYQKNYAPGEHTPYPITIEKLVRQTPA